MKIYFNLIFTLLLSFTIQVVFGECDISFNNVKIEQSTSCSKHNGSISLTVGGSSGPYSYRWDNVTAGEYIKYSKTPSIDNISGGDYKLTVYSLFSNCRVSKIFLVHGIIQHTNKVLVEDCTTSAYPAEVVSVKAIKDGSGYSFDVGSKGGINSESLDVIFRKKPDSHLNENSIWEDIPKPDKIFYGFEYGATYEFAYENAFGSFWGNSFMSGHISKPFIYIHLPANAKTKSIIEENFTIAPLPADDYLNITPLTESKIQSIEILGLNGKLLNESVVGFDVTTSLDTSNLPSGLYLLRINSEKETFLKKIIKN